MRAPARNEMPVRLLLEKRESMDDLQITPAETKARIEKGEKLLLVDVREPWEYELCRIEGAKLIPLGTLAANVNVLLDADDVICYCHHGIRSLDAAAWLRFQGVATAKSLAGGIERWSVDVDSKIPRY
jgi:rhodanese-related sulfurtransferase